MPEQRQSEQERQQGPERPVQQERLQVQRQELLQRVLQRGLRQQGRLPEQMPMRQRRKRLQGSLDGLIFCFCNTPSGFLQIVLQKRLAIAFCVLLLQNACQDVLV